MLIVRTRFLISALLLVIGVGASAQQISPYYPEVKTLKYVSRTIPKSDLSVSMKNGVSFKLGRFEKTESLDGIWKCSGIMNSKEPFDRNVDMDKGYSQSGYDDKNWDDIPVPLNWYNKYPKAQKSDAPYAKGWYRRTIAVPASEQGKSVVMHFGVIGYAADLYVNGQLAGSHHGDFIPWEIDITRYVKYGSTNSIAIRVLSDFGPSFGVKAGAKHSYGDQWGIGDIKAGLWQSVKVTYVPDVYVSKALVSPNLAKSSIEVEYWIQNGSGKTQRLILNGIVQSAMKSGKDQPANVDLGALTLAPGMNHGTVSIKLANPKLWTPETPNLYYLVLALTDGKKVITAHADRFGFRDFKAKGPNFYLNGKRIYLFGENLASIGYGGSGKTHAEEFAAMRNALLGFKSCGYNIVRAAHQPIVPEVLDLADEIGFMIYDEWSWAFTNNLDEKAFEKNNIQELKEWMYRDYNNPSVVMWSCGNEVNYDGNPVVYRQLNKQVDLARKLDRSGRPVSNFSGSAFFFGKWKLNTDIVDYHTYLGLSAPAWTHWEDDVKKVIKYDADVYGKNGKFDKPFVVWESIGYSWGQVSDPGFVPGDVDAYMTYANKLTSWGSPNGVGFSGTIGLAAALDPARGCVYGMEIYGKRTLEIARYNDRIQGMAPWFLQPGLNAAALWNQSTLCGMHDSRGLPPRNFFSGRVYKQSTFIVNSQNSDWKNADLRVVLVGADGRQQLIGNYKIDVLKAWEKKDHAVSLRFPEKTVAGNYQMRLTLMNGKEEISRNFYNIFIQNPSVTTASIRTTKRISILKPESTQVGDISKIFLQLGIKADVIADLHALKDYDVLVVPPARSRHSLLNSQDNRELLMKWISSGGTLLSMEQNYGNKVWLGGSLQSGELPFADLVVPKHPIFDGLTQDNFDTWSNPDYGNVISYGLAPFTVNALAARGPFCGSRGVLNAIAEGSYGTGRILASQLNATSLWNIDSVATTYLRNLLVYTFGDKQVAKLRHWSANRIDVELRDDQVQLIDLRPYANKSFSDDVSGDQLGGWTDQGDNDFRMIPLGKRMINGVPFEIIDPAPNKDKSCIILSGPFRTYYPGNVDGINVGANMSQLFFLHALAWGGGDGSRVGAYRINYADGTTEEVAMKDGVNVADWFCPGDLAEAQMGLTAKHRSGADVGLWVFAWDNPKPSTRIDSIDVLSDCNSAMPIVVAITGKKANPD